MGHRDTLPELPQGWVLARLDNLFCWSNGKNLTQKKLVDGIYKVYGGNGITGKHNEWLCENESLVIGRVGAQCGNVHLAPEKSWITDNALYTSWKSHEVHLNYFFYLLSHLRLNEFAGGSGQPYVSQAILNPLLVHFPSLAEQHRIVDKIEELFSELDAGVELLKKLKAKLKRYRQALLKAAVEGKLTKDWREAHQGELEPASVLLERILKERREKWEAEQIAQMKAKGKTPKDDSWKLKYKEPVAPDTSDLFELPEGWVWSRAEQACDFITKGTTPKAEKLYSSSGEIPFIKVYNLTNHGLLNFNINPTFISKDTHLQELARSRVLPGDVLMNIVGPPLGKVSVVPETYPEWNMNQAIAVFRPMPSYNRKFLCFSLMAENLLLWAKRRAKATAGQFNLTLEICRDLPLPLPSALEQHYIIEELERCFSVTDELEKVINQNLKRAEKLRQSILKKAFEGKLVSQDPTDEPADKLLERIKAEKAKREAETKAKKKRKQPGKSQQLELF